MSGRRYKTRVLCFQERPDCNDLECMVVEICILAGTTADCKSKEGDVRMAQVVRRSAAAQQGSALGRKGFAVKVFSRRDG